MGVKDLKTILICIYNLQGGGAEKVLINLLKLLKYKYKVTLLVLRKEGIYLDKIPKGINVIYGFKSFLGNKFANKILKFLSSKRLYYMFVKQSFDIEISFLEGFSTKVISGSNSKSKKIAWVHADFKTYHWTSSIFTYDEERDIYNKYDTIVCVSNTCGKSFKEIFGFDNKIKIIHNLLDESLENYTNINFNNVFNVYKKTKILYVGRVEKEKGINRLIKAFQKIINLGYDNINLFIVGDGSLKDELKKYINNNKLNNIIKFISFKENIYDYMLSADYIVVPSYSESFSLVLAEAIYLNKLCISTDTAGAQEVLKNGKYGLIVHNSEEGIFKGLLDILNDNKLRERYILAMSNRNYDFSRNNVINKIYKLLE